MGTSGTKIGSVEKHHCVVRAIRQRYAPIPCILSGLDPWLMGQAAAVPVAIERERALTGALFTTAQDRRSAAGVCEEISIESPGSVRGLDIEMPALIIAHARAHHGGLHHTHAVGASANGADVLAALPLASTKRALIPIGSKTITGSGIATIFVQGPRSLSLSMSTKVFASLRSITKNSPPRSRTPQARSIQRIICRFLKSNLSRMARRCASRPGAKPGDTT